MADKIRDMDCPPLLVGRRAEGPSKLFADKTIEKQSAGAGGRFIAA